MADPGGLAVKGVGMWPLTCWECRFESQQGHGYLSVVSCVVQVEASATGQSLVQMSPTECVCVCVCVYH